MPHVNFILKISCGVITTCFYFYYLALKVMLYIFITQKLILAAATLFLYSIYVYYMCIYKYYIVFIDRNIYNSFKNTHDSKVHGSFKVQSTLFRNFHLACSVYLLCISFSLCEYQKVTIQYCCGNESIAVFVGKKE